MYFTLIAALTAINLQPYKLCVYRSKGICILCLLL